MKFRDKIKNKVKTTKLQQPPKPAHIVSRNFDQSHINVQFLNSDSKTQLAQIKVVGKWLQGYGVNDKGDQEILKLSCKWFRRTATNIQEIKKNSNEYQLSLYDVGKTLQAQCIPQAQGMQYEGMPIIKLVGPIFLDKQTEEQANDLSNAQKATFSVTFRQLNIQNIDQDQKSINQGRIMILNNSKIQIYGKKQDQTNQLLYYGEMFKNAQDQERTNYPESVIVVENGKMVSLLLNQNNDFVSVEFQNSNVRDVFCLLINKIRESPIKIVTQQNQKSQHQNKFIENNDSPSERIEENTETEINNLEESKLSEIKNQEADKKVTKDVGNHQNETENYINEEMAKNQAGENEKSNDQKQQVRRQQENEANQAVIQSLSKENNSDQNISTDIKLQQSIHQTQQYAVQEQNDFHEKQKTKEIIISSEKIQAQRIQKALQVSETKNQQVGDGKPVVDQEKDADERKGQVESETEETPQNLIEEVLSSQHNSNIANVNYNDRQSKKEQLESNNHQYDNLVQTVTLQSDNQHQSKDQGFVVDNREILVDKQNSPEQNQQQKIQLEEQSQVVEMQQLIKHVENIEGEELNQNVELNQREEMIQNAENIKQQKLDKAQIQQLVHIVEREEKFEAFVERQISKDNQTQTQTQNKNQPQYNQANSGNSKQSPVEHSQKLHSQKPQEKQYQQTPRKQEQIKNQTIKKLRQQLKTQAQKQCRQQFETKLREEMQKYKKQRQKQCWEQLQTLQKQLKHTNQKQLQQTIIPVLKKTIQKQLKSTLRQECYKQLKPTIKEECLKQLKPKIREECLKQLKPIIKEECYKQLKPTIKEECLKQLKPKIRQELEKEMKPVMLKQCRSELVPKIKEELQQLLRPIIRLELQKELKPKLRQEIERQLKPRLREELQRQLKPKIKEQTDRQLRPKIRVEVERQIEARLRLELEIQLKPKIIQQFRDSTKSTLKLYFSTNQATIYPTASKLPQIQPQQLIYYKNQQKILTKQNSQMLEKTKSLIAKIQELERELRRYHPQSVSVSELCDKQAKEKQQQQIGSTRVKVSVDKTKQQQLNQVDFPASINDLYPTVTAHSQKLTPYQQLKLQLNKSTQNNNQLYTKNNLLLNQKESLQQELMKYKVDLEELEAQKKHLQKKYQSLFTEIHPVNISNHSHTSNNQNIPQLLLTGSQSCIDSSPVKSSKELRSMKSITSLSSPRKDDEDKMRSPFSNKRIFTETKNDESQFVGKNTEYQRLSQAILNHYSTQQQLNVLKKQVTQLLDENCSLRTILKNEKKTSIPLLSSSSSSKQLKLQIIELKKLANRLTEQLTDKNHAIENLKMINREINTRLVDITREYHLKRMMELEKEKNLPKQNYKTQCIQSPKK